MTDSICELRHRSLHGDRAVRTVNRTESTKGEDDPVYYCTNQLKQYDFTAAAAPPCSTQPADVFEHDEDGTLIAAPLGETPTAHTLEWDAENRLKAAYPTTPEAGSKKVEYTYDYMNRRVERIVTNWDPELGENGDWGDVSQDTKYVYHGWNVILELNALSSNAITKKYTWGLDLAGLNGAVNSLDQAGGIGGSLACLDTGGTPSTGDDRTFVYCHDANGNVTQLVETTTGGNYGTLAAAYEYDAYGNTIVASGGYAASNLIRFSNRPVEALTGLGHWPIRIYDFDRGRWIKPDPLEFADGANLLAYLANAPTNAVDPRGTQSYDWQSAQYLSPTFQRPCRDMDPNDEQCCLRAKAQGLQWRFGAGGAAAGVICCNGRKVMCVWDTDLGWFPDQMGNRIVSHCMHAHEQTHLDDIDCPSCSCCTISRPLFKPGKIPKNEECAGYIAEMACLKRQISACGVAPNPTNCAANVNMRISTVTSYISQTCPFPPPPKKVLYIPGVTE